MGVYSAINLDIINEILQYYELGKAVTYESTIEGISNSNYRVELCSGKCVLLKISNDKTIEQLANEQRILLALKNHNFEYSLHPIETIYGKPIYTHGNFYGVVFPFIQGLPPKITIQSIFQIGRALGRLHSLEIRKEDLDTIRSHDLVGHDGISINEYTLKENIAPEYKEAFLEIFPDRLQNIPYSLFPAGIIHGDLYFDNSLFDQGKLVTLIDFEQSGTGRYILDIGIAISGSCLNEDRTNIDNDLMNSFLKGYEEARKLVQLEKEYLNTAILVGFFSISLWRIQRFYDGQLDDGKKFNYQELLKRAKNFHRKFGV